MGTTSSSYDEWIELENLTDAEIDLAGWRLESADGFPTVVLAGVIPASGFFLLERGDDGTVSDVPADLVYGTQHYSWTLGNGGEHLRLIDRNGATVDEIPAHGGWFAGIASPDYRSMERVNPARPGTDPDNWRSHDARFAQNGLDVDGDPIRGTPRAPNAATNPPTAAFTWNPDAPTSWDVIAFADLSSDLDGTIAAWAWTFGNGDASTDRHPEHRFRGTGTYLVSVEVQDNDGLRGTTTGAVTVTLGPGDVDHNGTIDVCDVRILLQAVTGIGQLEADRRDAADTDRDGDIDADDVQRLAEYLIGL